MSADAPYLDMAYKLVAFDGRPTMKLSSRKATWPGPKQVWRHAGGLAEGPDHLATADEPPPAAGARALLQPVVVDGRRVVAEDADAARERWSAERERLPGALRALDATAPAPRVTRALAALRDEVAAAARRA